MKKNLLCLFLLLAFIQTTFSNNILIVYDGEEGGSDAYLSALYTRNMLEHFLVRQTTVVNVSEYSKGMTENKDCIFVIFEAGESTIPPVFLEDVLQTEVNVVWLHSHIDQLLALSENKWNVSFDRSEQSENWKVFYKNEDFPKEDPWLNILKIEGGKGVEVFASVQDEQGTSYPYALKSQNLWYFGDSPYSYAVEGGRFLIFADLLHDILNTAHPREQTALIRIEDVNPESDPKNLKRTARYLFRKRIPFQISLIPVYKNPDIQYEVRLSEQPKLLKAVKYAVSKNGAVVMHGVTHQHRGESGDDYEFWDDISGTPIRMGSPEVVERKIEEGIAECLQNGIFPLAWETPHYSAGQDDYKVFAKYFDTFFDRVMVTELSSSQQIMPFSVKLSDLDVQLIPENLGYLPLENPNPEGIIDNARNMLVVRDAVASFFYHPFVPIKNLKKIVKAMKTMGWTFVSLKDFNCQVKGDKIRISTSGRVEEILLQQQFLHTFIVNSKGKIENEEISGDRLSGTWNKEKHIPLRSVFVAEASDSLPASKEIKFADSVRIWVNKILKKEKDEELLEIVSSLVFVSRTPLAEDDFDQQSYLSVLNAFGFRPDTAGITDLRKRNLENYDYLVVPYSSAILLDEDGVNTLLGYVEKGGKLITEGKTPLAQRLGIGFEARVVETSEIRELTLPVETLQWTPPVAHSPCFARDAQILAKDEWLDVPLALVKPLVRGEVLYLAARFDPFTPYGMSRFPYFHHYLRTFLGVPFTVRRNTLEYYFDPGLRQNTSWEKLVKRWKASGVKVIYLATWHFYRDYQFDYDYFIQLCHEHGIAVYAWFEFPQVTPLLWEEHPEWREKTATGKDGQTHWRYLMNLFNVEAREAARDYFRSILSDYNWDGVNLAELNFDTNLGTQDPHNFTPMNMDVREAFREQEGFDPLLLFDTSSSYYCRENAEALAKFLAFRTQITKDLHLFFLEELEEIKKATQKNIEVILTVMDTLNHPELIEDCGIDILDIITLMDRFPFMLQVQDPSRSWTNPPSRYYDYYMLYRNYIEDEERLMFDINIIVRRDIASRHLTSPILTGTELAMTVHYAAMPSGRVGIYSEYTVHPFDMDMLPYVMGSDVKIEKRGDGYSVSTQAPFILSLNGSNYQPYVNREKWPFYGTTGIALPSGQYHLSFEKIRMFNFQPLGTRILLEGDIRSIKAEGASYSVVYESRIPVPLTFSRPLEWLKIDSVPLSLKTNSLGAVLPSGRHELDISTGSQTFQVIDEAGYLSSTLFSFLGLLSVLVLAVLYFYSRMKR